MVIFYWQVDIMICQVNINNWQVNIKIWQVDIIIWQVMAEIWHHTNWIRESKLLYIYTIVFCRVSDTSIKISHHRCKWYTTIDTQFCNTFIIILIEWIYDMRSISFHTVEIVSFTIYNFLSLMNYLISGRRKLLRGTTFLNNRVTVIHARKWQKTY